jgi:regulator of sirC expression with transglutaminase-like and TPR domain
MAHETPHRDSGHDRRSRPEIVGIVRHRRPAVERRPHRPGTLLGGPPSAKEIGRGRLEALVRLLDDDSPTVRTTARRVLEQADGLADCVLRRAARDGGPRVRLRARAILGWRQQQGVLRRLYRRAARREIDLESSLFLLGRIDRPELDSRPFAKTLDAMAAEVAARAAREPKGLSRLMVLPQYLGNDLGFIGSRCDFHHPDNIHLHRALDRKRGMPLTLVAVYILVARRAGIHAAALPLPGRVLLRLRADGCSIIIDPFLGGRLRTHDDCLRYLAKHGMVPRPEWFRDATDRMLFQRHLRNLMNSFQIRRMDRMANALSRVARFMNRTQAGSTSEPRFS